MSEYEKAAVLPWIERIGILSINPHAASIDDIARMAAELLEYKNDEITNVIGREKLDALREEVRIIQRRIKIAAEFVDNLNQTLDRMYVLFGKPSNKEDKQ